MRILLVFTFSFVALAVAPLAAADQAPAAFDLCSLAPNPLLVQVGALSDCTASAECDPFADISCTASGSSTSCSSADRDCSSGERGFVTCNGDTTYCAGPCCGSDGVCEYDFGCGCDDPDCSSRLECLNCSEDGFCNFDCGCHDPDCEGTEVCCSCGTVTDCQTDADCCTSGSICTSSGTCLCA